MAQSEARRPFFGLRRTATAEPRRPTPLFVGLPSFWKAMIITSFVMNIILLLVFVLLGAFLFSWRNQIVATTFTAQGFARENVTELQSVVAGLQSANIKTTIPLSQPLGLNLMVPIDQTTMVTTTQDVPLSVPAYIDMGPYGQLYPQVNLNLPAGTPLMIRLKLDVPLETTIPVKLNVPVDIPLKDTELGPQFERLGKIVDRLVTPAAPLLGIDKKQESPTPPQK
jgi:hypothetical protein